MTEKIYADNLSKTPGEIANYRAKKSYTGKEDDSVSGRAAIDEYVKKAKQDDISRLEPGYIPTSKSGAEAAQAKQREVMSERRRETKDTVPTENLKKGGSVKKMAGGGKVRGCGIAQRGKTKGRMV